MFPGIAKAQESPFNDDVRRQYYESGVLHSEKIYHRGKLKKIRKYYESGELELEKIVKKVGGDSYFPYDDADLKEYYENGQLRGKAKVRNGQLIKSISYFKNGSINREIKFKGKKKFTKTNWENGMIKEENVYNNDTFVTEKFKKYTRQGKLYNHSVYDYKKKEYKKLVDRSYFEDGTLASENNWFDDGTVHSKDYYENGQLKWERKSKEGRWLMWDEYDEEGNFVADRSVIKVKLDCDSKEKPMKKTCDD